jgi:hypothetical protein
MLARSIGLVYPLWNHRTPDSLLEQLHDAAPLDHVTLPVVTGPRAQFRYLESPERPYFNTDGGWHYQPDRTRYEGCPVAPVTADWLSGDDPLEPVAEIARRRSIALAVRIRVTQVPRLLAAAPHLRQRDAWGQVRRRSRLCPNQPAVRDLLRAVLHDLQRYGPIAAEIEDFGTSAATYYSNWSTAAGWYRGGSGPIWTCFCDGCRAIAVAAGLDPDRRRAARERAHCCHMLSPPLDQRGRLDAHRDESLDAFARARVAENAVWLNRLADEFPKMTFLTDFSPNPYEASSENLVRQLDPQRWSGIGGGQTIHLDLQPKPHRTDGLLPLPGQADQYFVRSRAVSLDAPHRALRALPEETEQLRLRVAAGASWWEFEPLGDGAPDEFDHVCRRIELIRQVFAHTPAQPDDGPSTGDPA